jgi:hypothetical protein
MKSVTTLRFRKCYSKLPSHIKIATKNAYKHWQANPYNSSLQFKKIHTNEIYSVRISISYRALSIKENDTYVWFWIGSHAEYDQTIS